MKASEYIPLESLPELLAANGGRTLHPSTPRRWASKGLCGVRLRAIAFGRRRYTKPQWLEEFATAIAAASKCGAEGDRRG